MREREFDQLRDDTLAFYLRLVAAAGPRLAATRRRLLDEGRDRLAAGRYQVVVVGEFRRGKSSLLNALVERSGIFPVDVNVTTCAVATLHWDHADNATVFYAPDDSGDPATARAPELIALDRVAEFVTEQANPANDKNVLLIEMGAPLRHLESGLVLVDTPGLGSVNPAHTAATKAYLPNADAILFVASALEPLSVPELDFLRLALAECQVVLTALTMIDKVNDPSVVIAEARSRVAGVVQVDPEELVIVPVSSLRKWRAIADDDPDLLQRSGFPELEAELWGGLAVTCGVIQVSAALDEWEAALTEVTAPLENELAGLRGDWATAAAKLAAEQEQYRKLMADSHAWRRDLQRDIEVATQPVQRRLESDLDDIRDQFGQALRDDDVISRAGEVIQRASDAMVDAANQANADLQAAMTELAAKYRKITEFKITLADVTGPPSEAGLTAAVPVLQQQRQQNYSRFREMWLGASAGAAAGGLIGLIGGPVGAAVGSFVGFVAGLFGGRKFQRANAEEQQRRAYLAELRENVLPKLESGRRRIVRDVSDQVRNYGRALTNTLEDEARARGESLAESIRLNEQTQRRDAAARAARERELVSLLEEDSGLTAELAELRSRTSTLSRRRSGKATVG